MAELDRSPRHKRQRMSSPAYDIDEMTGSDFDVLDEIELRMSQKTFASQRTSQGRDDRVKRSRAIAEAFAVIRGKEGEDTQDVVGGRLTGAEPQLSNLVSASKLRGLDEPSSQTNENAPIASTATHISTMPAMGKMSGPLSGFTSALNVSHITPLDMPSSPSEAHPEADYDAWFQSDSTSLMPVGFTSAKLIPSTKIGDEDDGLSSNASQYAKLQDPTTFQLPSQSGFRSAKAVFPSDSATVPEMGFPGFQSAKSVEKSASTCNEVNTLAMPGFQSARAASSADRDMQHPLVLASKRAQDKYALSTDAIRRAAERMQQWAEEDVNYDANDIPDTPTRPAPRTMQSSSSSAKSMPSIPNRTPRFSSPLVKSSVPSALTRPKAFKSPLLTGNASKPINTAVTNVGHVNSPLNPTRKPLAAYNNSIAPTASSVSGHTFVKPAPSAAESAAVPAPPVSTPRKSLGVTPRRGLITSTPTTVKKFVTPFKSGLKPGEPGRLRMEQEIAQKKAAAVVSITGSPIKRSSRVGTKGRWFDMSPGPDRQTLLSSELVPQSRTQSELEVMGINVVEMTEITPASAMYYVFNMQSASLPILSQNSRNSTLLGPSAMLDELLARGCRLATQAWVENHWGLILWKLAGMVCLDPKSESNTRTRRWCWSHVCEQFLYRYEKELEGGVRPPFKLIATQDAPAVLPMVLCVSNITWSSRGTDDEGLVTDQIPELELTDGWYKLRAEVDGPLTRAIRKGKLRIGRKLCVQNAKLSSDHKEPAEILEAYNKCHLVLAGNSCHLAPWHAKLGFSRTPSFATLGSLSADGGVVTVMELVVVKAHPLAFIEFVEGPDGKTRRIGPHSEKEETKAREQWERRRQDEAMKLRESLEKKISTLEGYAHRLEAKAGIIPGTTPDGDCPAHIENYFEDLEETGDISSLLSRLNVSEMRWLVHTIRMNCIIRRETSRDKMEKTLSSDCPPRNVRSFRVVIAKDARTCKRQACRKAQLTVWDALDLTLGDGAHAGFFTENQRFIVTNLVPTQQSAWMANEPDAEIYLSTRRDSRWTKIRERR